MLASFDHILFNQDYACCMIISPMNDPYGQLKTSGGPRQCNFPSRVYIQYDVSSCINKTIFDLNYAYDIIIGPMIEPCGQPQSSMAPGLDLVEHHFTLRVLSSNISALSGSGLPSALVHCTRVNDPSTSHLMTSN